MEYVDFVISAEGFQDELGKFVIKEIAVVDLVDLHFSHWFVISPHDFTHLPRAVQVLNNIATEHVHGIEWFQGDISLSRLQRNLQEIVSKARFVFTHGQKLTTLLRDITGRRVENLEDYKCPPIASLPDRRIWCIFHAALRERKENMRCALHSAIKLRKWMCGQHELLMSIEAFDLSVFRALRDRADRLNQEKQATEEKKKENKKTSTTKLNSDPASSSVPAEKREESDKNGHDSAKACSSVLRNAFSSCMCGRSHSEGVDETDVLHS